MMSAPSAAIRRAWLSALPGSKKRPPSENESGVTLRMPMTAGQGCFASKEASVWPLVCRVGAMSERRCVAIALRRAGDLCQARGQRYVLAIGDLGRELPCLLDPARDQLLGGQEANELALLVLFRHGGGKIGWIAVAQLSHRADAGSLQQVRITFAHALD